jgi:hypothetical protein
MELAFLTGALSGHFAVLAAHDATEATRLVARFGPCRLAYLALDGPCEASVRLARELNGAASSVFALIHPPSPEAVDTAWASSGLDGVCLLPLAPEALLAKTRMALGLPAAASLGARPLCAVLTREEVNFLTSRPLAEAPAAARQAVPCGQA